MYFSLKKQICKCFGLKMHFNMISMGPFGRWGKVRLAARPGASERPAERRLLHRHTLQTPDHLATRAQAPARPWGREAGAAPAREPSPTCDHRRRALAPLCSQPHLQRERVPGQLEVGSQAQLLASPAEIERPARRARLLRGAPCLPLLPPPGDTALSPEAPCPELSEVLLGLSSPAASGSL